MRFSPVAENSKRPETTVAITALIMITSLEAHLRRLHRDQTAGGSSFPRLATSVPPARSRHSPSNDWRRTIARFFRIEPYLWEYEAMVALGTFPGLDLVPPSAFDIVVLIVWSRLEYAAALNAPRCASTVESTARAGDRNGVGVRGSL